MQEKIVQVLSRGPLYCGNWVAFFALLSLLFLATPLGFVLSPLALCLSTAVQSFAIMVFGLRGAGISLILALLILVLVGTMAGISTSQSIVFFSLFWVPSSLISMAWARSKALPFGLLIASLLSITLMVTAHGLLGPEIEEWKTKATELLLSLLAERQLKAEPQAIQAMFKYAVGMLVSMLYIVWVISAFLSKSWASRLQNGGGFREEFYQLRSGKMLLLPIICMLGMGLLTQGNLSIVFLEVAGGLSLLYAMQGLAVVHWLAGSKKINSGWLWGLYSLFIFAFLPTGIFLTLIGAGDNWLGIRAKFS